MVYVAFSEFFFDSAMESYFQAGALQLTLVGDKVYQGLSEGGLRTAHERVQLSCLISTSPVQVPSDLDILLRATYFGSIVLLVSIGQRLGCGQGLGCGQSWRLPRNSEVVGGGYVGVLRW